jgi:hypothetical protein
MIAIVSPVDGLDPPVAGRGSGADRTRAADRVVLPSAMGGPDGGRRSILHNRRGRPVAWESRKSGRYFYTALYRDGRTIKRYVGRGAAGELAARLDAESRRRRREEEAALRAERDRLGPALRSARELDALCDLFLVARLTSAGFHRANHGPWRRRRGGAPAADRSD